MHYTSIIYTYNVAYSYFMVLYQALYHTLPMKYVSLAKLQNKLEGEANQTTVLKIIDRMTRDGFVEAKGNRRLGECSCCQLPKCAWRTKLLSTNSFHLF